MFKKIFISTLSLSLFLGTFSISVFAEETDAIIIGNVPLQNGEYIDNAGNVSTEKPEDGYAYYKDHILILNDYHYEGTGYQKEHTFNSVDENYLESSVIFFDGTLTIQVEKASSLTNTFPNEENQYSTGILGDDVTITGETLTLQVGSESIYADNVIIESGTLIVEGGTAGIYTDKMVTITDSIIQITTDEDGIYATDGLLVSNSTLDISSGYNCIYIYEGDSTIEHSSLTLTTIDKKMAVKTDIGSLKIGEDLSINEPENGTVKEFTALYDADGDNIKETEYTYQTIVDSEGNFASKVSIIPDGK